MKGKCEVFEKEKCTGCEGLDPQYNIDETKWKCEDYLKWRKTNENRNTIKAT